MPPLPLAVLKEVQLLRWQLMKPEIVCGLIDTAHEHLNADAKHTKEKPIGQLITHWKIFFATISHSHSFENRSISYFAFRRCLFSREFSSQRTAFNGSFPPAFKTTAPLFPLVLGYTS
jgi:hypothetical protein